MRFCVVRLRGEVEPRLAKWTTEGLVPLDAPASLRGALEAHGDAGLIRLAEAAGGPTFDADVVERWLSPIPDPRTFRDFYAFEQHVKTARRERVQDMIPEWYQIPVFYFSNPCTLHGHLEPVKRPTAGMICRIGRKPSVLSPGSSSPLKIQTCTPITP